MLLNIVEINILYVIFPERNIENFVASLINIQVTIFNFINAYSNKFSKKINITEYFFPII